VHDFGNWCFKEATAFPCEWVTEDAVPIVLRLDVWQVPTSCPLFITL